MPNNRILELESIRGVAALFVMLLHYFAWNPFLNLPIITNSYLMVELFFVLSGFVIFNAYNNKIKVTNDLLKFQFLRLGRLYPVHLLFLALFLLREIAKLMSEQQFGVTDIRVLPFGENTFLAFFQHIFLLQAVIPTGNAYTFNIPAWSISVEFYTYLVFAAVLLYFNRFKVLIFSVFAVIAFALLASHHTFGFEWLLRCVAGFFIGCLLAASIKNSKCILPAYVSLFIFILLLVFLQFKTTKTFDVAIFLISAALIASLVLAPNGLLNKLLKLRLFVWLGEISYSLYMSHYFVLFMVTNYFKRFLNYPDIQNAQGAWVPSLSLFGSTLSLILFICITLLLSELVYLYIESPMRQKSRHWANEYFVSGRKLFKNTPKFVYKSS